MSSEIKIESGVPLPKRASKIPLPKGVDEALGQMNVGQSLRFCIHRPLCFGIAGIQRGDE